MKLPLSLLILLALAGQALGDDFNIWCLKTAHDKNLTFESIPKHFDYNLLNNLPLNPRYPAERYQILNLGDSIIAVRDGCFDLFLLVENEWVNLYNGELMGFNYGQMAFVHQGGLYALGGYGFWEHHLKLIRFNFDIGLWDLVPTTNTPEDLEPLIIAIDDSRISLILGSYRDQLNAINNPSFDHYDLSLNSFQYLKQEHPYESYDFERNKFFKSFVNTNEFAAVSGLMHSHVGLLIFHKKSRQLVYSLDNPEFNLQINYQEFIYSDSSRLLTLDMLNSKLVEIDLRKAYEKGIPIARATSAEPKLWLSLGIPLFLLLLVILLFVRKWSRKTAKSAHQRADTDNLSVSESSSTTHEIMAVLLKGKSAYDIQELDEVLGIGNVEYDLRRVKRSQLIKKINDAYYQDHQRILIKRVRQPDDKRFIKYVINRNT